MPATTTRCRPGLPGSLLPALPDLMRPDGPLALLAVPGTPGWLAHR